jgi:subtilase-type serine protease
MSNSFSRRRALLAGSALFAMSMAAAATPAHAIVPNETTDSEAIVDNEDEFRGVGQFFRADGFVCTGTLINPRTVLFAAHCVNDRPETDYNADNIAAAFSFNVDALPGFQNWFANNFASNPDLAVFNISRIFYDPRSLEDAFGLGFIQADIALATLDTPAAGIPTWALLFSTLPAPDSIDPVRGTGYHVNIVGYGGTGNAAQGPVDGVDFRRRAAENLLGGFFSLDDQDNVLFGPGPDTFPNNLYQLDFDSQDRDPVFDINVHRDDALPNEGTTAGGDSGGPLILDAANNTLSNEDLVIGVLSGGSRFFGGGQPFSSIGTTSFYQPLSLYWQYITATNPYRYVGAVAGNGNWEDASRWVTLLDPAYRVINAQGQVVNGVPTTPELGVNGTEGDFGAICVEFESPGDGCVDLATGEFEDTSPPVEAVSGEVGNNRARVSLDAVAGTASQAVTGEGDLLEGSEVAAISGRASLGSDVTAISGSADLNTESVAINGRADLIRTEIEAQEEGVPATLPAPTLANGLPGARNFTVNNVDAVTTETVRIDPRYFDVTLSETGTTTLSSTVTIDRLTVRNAAGLTVAAAGDLTSLIDINQFGGLVSVNGGLTSVGDYTLFAGMLAGTGTVTAPFLTSVTGVFSPGTMGTTGTLNIDGNLVMSSGTTFLVDVGANGASDRLAVTGEASVGGIVNIGSAITQQVNGNGQRFTILTAAEGVTGTFTERNISSILSQSFIYQENAVLLEIEAASYASVIDANDPNQVAYAQLFDQNRGNAALSGLFALDFATTETIRNTFVRLAPLNEQAVRSLSSQTVNLIQNFNDARLRESDRDSAGGKITVIGSPLNAAQAGLAPNSQPLGANLMGLQDGEKEEMAAELPDNVGIYLAGGLVTGDARSLTGFDAGTEAAGEFIARRTEYSGYFLAGGLEFFPGENTVVGISGYINSIDADVPLGQEVESDTYAASIYARHALAAGPVLDGQFTIGSIGFDTARRVQFLGASQTLTSSTDNLLVQGALGLSYDLETGIGTFSPGIEGRYASVDLSTVRETGGTLALTVARERFESTQARVGFDFEENTSSVQINANAQFVHEFQEGPQLLAANFAQGTGPNANFVLNGADHNWVELGINAQVGTGPVKLGAGFDTTIGRDSANARVFRGSLSYSF